MQVCLIVIILITVLFLSLVLFLFMMTCQFLISQLHTALHFLCFQQWKCVPWEIVCDSINNEYHVFFQFHPVLFFHGWGEQSALNCWQTDRLSVCLHVQPGNMKKSRFKCTMILNHLGTQGSGERMDDRVYRNKLDYYNYYHCQITSLQGLVTSIAWTGTGSWPVCCKSLF